LRFNPGTIYFVRETTDDQGGLSTSVKIGLVEDPRTAQQRLSEHQTGNPRRLVLNEDHLIHTDAVKYVESQLHKTFAPHRISGEWFRFESEAAVREAAGLAQTYAKQVGEKMPSFEKAKTLKLVLSEGDILGASETILGIAKEVSLASVTLDAYDQLISRIDSVFKNVIAEEGHVALERIIKVINVVPDPAFSVAEFKKELKTSRPELIEKCIVEEPKLSEDFKLLFELTSDAISKEVTDYISTANSVIEKSIAEKDYFRLNELKLEVKRLKAPLEWIVESGEADIKVECGTAPGIEGVCSWVRKITTKKSFSSGILRELEPELYERFVIQKEPYTREVFIGYKA
jgi:hypothetical protein